MGSPRGKSRAFEARHGVAASATPFERWSRDVQAEQDDERREVLREVGHELGFVDDAGRIIDPDTTPEQGTHDEANAAIRRAVGAT
ncbi:MAG TPA: hypothetical protein VIW19_15890 [Gaiellaceae bacterium]|jgi:hypothetical protein